MAGRGSSPSARTWSASNRTHTRSPRTKAIERLHVDGVGIALPVLRRAAPKLVRRRLVGREAQPVEVVEHRRLVLRPASAAIVVFHAEDDTAAGDPSEAPDVDRVDDVPEVEVPGRSGGEPRRGPIRRPFDQPSEVRALRGRHPVRQRPVTAGSCRPPDGVGDFRRQHAKLGVDSGRGGLNTTQRRNLPPIHALSGDREVLDGSLRLRAPPGARRNPDLSHRVALDPRLARLAARHGLLTISQALPNPQSG